MNSTETEQLAELIRRRHAALIGLRDLGRRQLELIDAEQMGPLLTLLAGKQRLLGDLQSTERALDPFRKQDPAARHWSSAADRERCARLAADCQSLLAEIAAQDQAAEASMVRRRDQTVNSLARLHTAGAVRRLRGRSHRPAPLFGPFVGKLNST